MRKTNDRETGQIRPNTRPNSADTGLDILVSDDYLTQNLSLAGRLEEQKYLDPKTLQRVKKKKKANLTHEEPVEPARATQVGTPKIVIRGKGRKGVDTTKLMPLDTQPRSESDDYLDPVSLPTLALDTSFVPNSGRPSIAETPYLREDSAEREKFANYRQTVLNLDPQTPGKKLEVFNKLKTFNWSKDITQMSTQEYIQHLEQRLKLTQFGFIFMVICVIAMAVPILAGYGSCEDTEIIVTNAPTPAATIIDT